MVIGRAKMAAVSSAASLAIVGVVLLTVAPVMGANADTIEPCEVGEVCDDSVTVTVTETPEATPSSESSPESTTPAPTPVVTVTVTPTPTPSPASTRKADPPSSAPPTRAIQVYTPPPIVEPAPSSTSTPESELSLAPAPSESPTPTVSFEEPAPETVAIEIRNASPEFDQVSLSRKLAAPAALLVLLSLLAWLVFEGRLRRMAHSAAARRVSPGRHPGGQDGVVGHPTGGAYAPVVSFVPVPTYPVAYQQHPNLPHYAGPYGAGPYGYVTAAPPYWPGPQPHGVPAQGHVGVGQTSAGQISAGQIGAETGQPAAPQAEALGPED